jgi:hypothetical protein
MDGRSMAYEQLCLTAEKCGLGIGIDIGEALPSGFNLQGEPNAWRHPLSALIAFAGTEPRQRVDIEQPDTKLNFDKACARLTGLLRLKGMPA